MRPNYTIRNLNMLQALKDRAAFVSQFRRQFETTGSITPSSRFLAASMTRFLAERDSDRPVRVLEVGPGTGPVTSRIVELLKPSDTFDLVELNEAFVAILRNKFETVADWQKVAEISTVHQLPLQDFNAPEKYDFVISGLPMVNFPADVVRMLSAAYFEHLKPGGRLSYFEYMYMRPLRKMVSSRTERQRVAEVAQIMQGHCDQHQIARDNVWINFPPAWVVHLRQPEDNAAQTSAGSAESGTGED